MNYPLACFDAVRAAFSYALASLLTLNFFVMLLAVVLAPFMALAVFGGTLLARKLGLSSLIVVGGLMTLFVIVPAPLSVPAQMMGAAAWVVGGMMIYLFWSRRAAAKA